MAQNPNEMPPHEFCDLLYDSEEDYEEKYEFEEEDEVHVEEVEIPLSEISFCQVDDDDVEQYYDARDNDADDEPIHDPLVDEPKQWSSASSASSPRLSSEAVSPVTRPSTPVVVTDGAWSRLSTSRGGRAVRGGRAAGAGRGGSRASNLGSWRQGHALNEIYVTDDDVPDDLRAAIMKVYERRQRNLNRRRRNVRNDGECADEGGDAALFPRDADAVRFDWRPMDSYEGEREPFLPEQTGPTTQTGSALEAFQQYWDDDILSHIVSETNRYAATRCSFPDWYDTNIHEILTLFAFWIMLGIIQMPSIKSCFSDHYLLYTSCFHRLFSRQRYMRLCAALHLNDDTLPSASKTSPIDPIVQHLNSRFKSAYIPRQEICIDESLTLWKGNLSFRQYIKTKAAKFGIKTFELCESATGYLWSFFIYSGKDCCPDPSLPRTLLKSTATVLSLIRPLLNKGYTLFMDNWFNSPLLARYLKRNKTDVVGTMRANCNHLPPLITECTLQAGQFAARHSGDMTIMAYHDKKKVTLISTYHGSKVAQAPEKPNRDRQWKPQLVLDYNKSMGGVDLKDGMLQAYLIERKRCKKWNLKMFKRLLNASILNSRICREAVLGKRIPHTVFRLEIVDEIFRFHLDKVPKHRRPPPGPSPSTSRFTGNEHWPEEIIKRLQCGRIARRKCVQCKRQTVIECRKCNVGVCATPCFGRHHSNLK